MHTKDFDRRVFNRLDGMITRLQEANSRYREDIEAAERQIDRLTNEVIDFRDHIMENDIVLEFLNKNIEDVKSRIE